MIELQGIRAAVTDIEGTTSSLAFVKDVLFPYARRALPDYVRTHWPELADRVAEIEHLTGREKLQPRDTIDILLRWMDEDRKVTPLKTLQGLIWRTGFESGELEGHVYEDAVRALRKWHADGLRLYVYSSGSVAAQKLLFGHTSHGDLLPLFSGYFDTTTGPKLESRSYALIASALGLAPAAIVFLSDHPGETQAAAAAGLQTVLVAREADDARTTVARTFDDIAWTRP
ncbi:MAG TPA: acireductone synthase [Steroidobacteraceae bacterium]|nr:acireductone synthase [Steroidobacteraceae bacterium]